MWSSGAEDEIRTQIEPVQNPYKIDSLQIYSTQIKLKCSTHLGSFLMSLIKFAEINFCCKNNTFDKVIIV